MTSTYAKALLVLQFAFLLICSCLHAEIKITAQIDGQNVYENQPVKVLVTISHAQSEKIVLDSFKIDKAKTNAKLLDEKTMTASGDLQLSIFQIELPAQVQGPHLLPQVEVTVGDKSYSTIPSTYVVLSGTDAGSAPDNNKTASPSKNDAPAAAQPGAITPQLKFEAFVEGPTTIYPGQKTLVGYKYSFNVSVDTLSEQTPLLEAKGLTKVGDKIVDESQQGSNSILKLYQIVKGDKPGEYVFGPSTLEGIPYQLTPSKEKVYAKDKLISTTPAVTIKVIPFPDAEKPTSFNGALGDFDWQVSLQSPSTVNVGDTVSLTVTATGQGDWDSVNLAELCCQPGMSGLFRLDDLPKVGDVQGNSKKFSVQIRPLSTSVKEIPSLEFSSLDPDKGHYRTVHSNPIPLTVNSGTIQGNQDTPSEVSPKEAGQWKEGFNTPSPLKIGNSGELKASDLRNRYFGSWWTLLLIPFGIGLLIYQVNCKNSIELKQNQNNQKKSEQYFSDALAEPPGTSSFYHLLKQAFLVKLVEHGDLHSEDDDPNVLPTTGIQGEVRNFLRSIDEMRYSDKATFSDADLIAKAKKLFGQL
jgi:hypothetical protein